MARKKHISHLQNMLYNLTRSYSLPSETEITVHTSKFDLVPAPCSAGLCGQYSPGEGGTTTCPTLHQSEKLSSTVFRWSVESLFNFIHHQKAFPGKNSVCVTPARAAERNKGRCCRACVRRSRCLVLPLGKPLTGRWVASALTSVIWNTEGQIEPEKRIL